MSKIIVKSKSESGFRRAGFQFTREGVELDTTKLKKGQLEEIEAEPNLVVVPVGEKDDNVLLGSDQFPALVKIGDAEVQLGELVAGAYTRSGTESVKAWNKLAAKKRDSFIQAEIDARTAELGNQGGAK